MFNITLSLLIFGDVDLTMAFLFAWVRLRVYHGFANTFQETHL